jgi:hypothetical protein
MRRRHSAPVAFVRMAALQAGRIDRQVPHAGQNKPHAYTLADRAIQELARSIRIV